MTEMLTLLLVLHLHKIMYFLKMSKTHHKNNFLSPFKITPLQKDPKQRISNYLYGFSLLCSIQVAPYICLYIMSQRLFFSVRLLILSVVPTARLADTWEMSAL